MKKGRTAVLILRYTVIGTVLSILVFFSISFLDLLYDLDTFSPYAQRNAFQFDFGVPFTYYGEQFIYTNTLPVTRFNFLNLLMDCVITWLLIALPYIIYKVRKRMPKETRSKDLIDQSEIEL
ncbi:MAG: hypothetical protein COA38_01555 [Fluviicola sp.]|nr:MAG: hypothetical protein COA38_01555 [Fluviicola sp.]